MPEPKWPHFGFPSDEINVRHFHVQVKSFLPPPRFTNGIAPNAGHCANTPGLCSKLAKSCSTFLPHYVWVYRCYMVYLLAPLKLLRLWSTVCLILSSRVGWFMPFLSKSTKVTVRKNHLGLKTMHNFLFFLPQIGRLQPLLYLNFELCHLQNKNRTTTAF